MAVGVSGPANGGMIRDAITKVSGSSSSLSKTGFSGSDERRDRVDVGNGSRIGRLKECAVVRVNLGVASLSRVPEKGFVEKR